MPELGTLLRNERHALIELLETLSADQWATPSLCTGWTVQDVAAHLAWMPALTVSEAFREMTGSGFRINTMIGNTAVRWSRRGPRAILEQLRRNTETNATPLRTSLIIGLADAFIHQLDIRRPLGCPRPIPGDAFIAVADLQTRVRWPSTIVVGGNVRRRIQGVRLVADGVSWAHGSGEEVRGSAEALLLMLTGRPFRGDELSGPGVQRVLSRQ